jgi:hypothetical protein
MLGSGSQLAGVFVEVQLGGKLSVLMIYFGCVCVGHVDLMPVKAFAMGQCVSDITCQSNLLCIFHV